jgi:hypothetical protein
MSDLPDMISELTSGHTNRQAYEVGEGVNKTIRHHRTYVPALIDQLDQATSSSGGVGGTGGPASRPAAWLEPLDTLALIDHESARWIRLLGDDDPADTKLCVRRLHGLWASQDEATKKRIERDVRGWYVRARCVTGWDSPAWRPDSTCPLCNERRTLRIKLMDQMAFCTDCGEHWSTENIGLLADHIRQESGSDDDGEAA